MIKKIKVEQLKPGVFVHDFNCGWLHHPFLADRTKLKSDEDIDKIVKNGIREVYIDTEKSLDLDDAPTQREAEEEIQAEIEKLPARSPQRADRERFKDEIARARQLVGEAREATKKLMHDIRRGKRMNMQQVEGLIELMTDSVLNDKGALVSLRRIKNIDEYKGDEISLFGQIAAIVDIYDALSSERCYKKPCYRLRR